MFHNRPAGTVRVTINFLDLPLRPASKTRHLGHFGGGDAAALQRRAPVDPSRLLSPRPCGSLDRDRRVPDVSPRVRLYTHGDRGMAIFSILATVVLAGAYLEALHGNVTAQGPRGCIGAGRAGGAGRPGDGFDTVCAVFRPSTVGAFHRRQHPGLAPRRRGTIPCRSPASPRTCHRSRGPVPYLQHARLRCSRWRP